MNLEIMIDHNKLIIEYILFVTLQVTWGETNVINVVHKWHYCVTGQYR